MLVDHQLLLTIFGEIKCIPIISAGKQQRWAMFLSGFH